MVQQMDVAEEKSFVGFASAARQDPAPDNWMMTWEKTCVSFRVPT
jgi:hypothetical protein